MASQEAAELDPDAEPPCPAWQIMTKPYTGPRANRHRVSRHCPAAQHAHRPDVDLMGPWLASPAPSAHPSIGEQILDNLVRPFGKQPAQRRGRWPWHRGGGPFGLTTDQATTGTGAVTVQNPPHGRPIAVLPTNRLAENSAGVAHPAPAPKHSASNPLYNSGPPPSPTGMPAVSKRSRRALPSTKDI